MLDLSGMVCVATSDYLPLAKVIDMCRLQQITQAKSAAGLVLFLCVVFPDDRLKD